MGNKTNARRFLAEKHKEKRRLERYRLVWENNIKIDLEEKVEKI
jgi:hypothetical protein